MEPMVSTKEEWSQSSSINVSHLEAFIDCSCAVAITGLGKSSHVRRNIGMLQKSPESVEGR